MRISSLFLAAALLASMSGRANAHDRDDGLLPEPPADAKAGQCFAKVVVPGQPVYGPPGPPQLKWVQSPPPPGAVGPLWCQVWEPGQPTMTMTPERYGWIRVICDKDATRERITHVQRRLHDWGVYEGGYDGRYDAATADAVRRFQAERHIAHGGYLSLQTLEALDTPPPPTLAPVQPPVDYADGYAPPAYTQPGYPQPGYPQPGYTQPGYTQPGYTQPGYTQGRYAPFYPGLAPCGVNPCGSAAPNYGPAAYGETTDSVRTYSVQYSVNRRGRPGN